MADPRKQLTRKIQRESSEWLDVQPAWLGDYSHTVQTGTSGTFYARLINGKVVQVFNQARVPATYDLYVRIGRRRSMPNIWQIIETVEAWTTPAASGQIEYHHEQHEEGGADRVNLDRKQILQFSVRVYDAESFVVKVGGGVFPTPVGLAQIDTQLVDLSAYIGTASASYVTIETDNDGTLSTQQGTDFGSPLVANISYVPAPASGKYTLAYILISLAFTELLDEHIVVLTPLAFNPSGYLTGVSWGDIDGTLSDQTDLQAALDAKADADDVVTSISKSGSTLLIGDVTLSAGSNVTLIQSGNNIEIIAGGGRLVMATGVTHPPVPVENAEGTDWIYST